MERKSTTPINKVNLSLLSSTGVGLREAHVGFPKRCGCCRELACTDSEGTCSTH